MRSSDRSMSFGCSLVSRSRTRSLAAARQLAAIWPWVAGGGTGERPLGRRHAAGAAGRSDARSACRAARARGTTMVDHAVLAAGIRRAGSPPAGSRGWSPRSPARRRSRSRRRARPDGDVAQHGEGGRDAAGGRVGQQHDIGQARLLDLVDGDDACAASASARGCLPACARRRRPGSTISARLLQHGQRARPRSALAHGACPSSRP